MKIGIIGGGATGLLNSYYLHMNHDVTLYVRRKEQVHHILKHGVHKVNEERKATIDVRIINDIQDEDLHILCVKSGDLPNVLSVIKKKALRSPILFLQNGMGHINLIRNLENPVFVGVIEHGAVRENDWTFNHLGRGQIRLASLQDDKDTIELAHELHSDEYKVESNEDWELMLKEKLIINAVINPLTALFNVDNRYIIENEYIKKLAKSLCKEVASVLKLSETKSWHKIEEVAHNTGDNTSSMRSDILNKRQTELDAIFSCILDVSDKPLHTTETVYRCIRALEERNK